MSEASRHRIVLGSLGAHLDNGGVGVLHAASAGAAGKMEDEQVVGEGPVVHPAGLACGRCAHHLDQAAHVVVARGRIHHDAVVHPALGNESLGEGADLHRRIHHLVIVAGENMPGPGAISDPPAGVMAVAMSQ